MGQPLDHASVIRTILEGTAGAIGQEFFEARLRALAFWLDNRFVPDYEYAVAGTPCEPVIDERRLLHIPDNVIEELLAYTEKHSPVCNSVCRPVPVVIERVARPAAR